MPEYITLIVGGLLSLFFVYYAVIYIVSLTKKFAVYPRHNPQKKIAAVIAARNEGNVIGECVKSLINQSYPNELKTVFVCPNNCTDNTKEEAEKNGAVIINVTEPVKNKGQALKWTFKKILDNYNDIDAIVVFDADNIVDKGFFQAVNNALCEGIEAAQGLRDSKNPCDSWISGSMSIFYWFMNGLFNRPRYKIGMSANFNGTGFMVSTKVLKKTGFETVSMTEDLEYTAQLALNDVKIGWMDDAVTYDEQPVKMKPSISQRRRWFWGSQINLVHYFRALVKKRTLQATDIAVTFFGVATQLLSLIPAFTTVLGIALNIIRGKITVYACALSLIASLGVSLVGFWLFAVFVLVTEKKKTTLSSVLLFPIFMLTWMLCNLSTFIWPPKGWTPIKHGKN